MADRNPRRNKLTISHIKALPPEDSEYIEWDTVITGLGVRVAPGGRKTFVLKYRVGKGRNAPVKKPTLGEFGEMTLDDARTRAKEYLGKASGGDDPMAEVRATEKAKTFGEMIELYVSDHVEQHNRASTAKEVSRMIDSYIPATMKAKAITDIEQHDIKRLKIRLKKTPYQANRVLAMVSKAFSEWGGDNPCKGVTRYEEQGRERYLDADEITGIMAAMGSYPSRVPVDALRLIMLTGARRGEALSARWDQFDFEAGVWIKPSAHTKQKKPHRVPLSPPALQLLESIPRTGDYLFPGRSKDTHLQGVQKAWKAICKEAGVEGVRVHDLRHTYASILANSGQSLLVIGALLGHTQPQTTARYTHLRDEALRQATKRVGDVYASGEGGGDVVPLKQG